MEAERCAVVQHGDADLGFADLTMEFLSHASLAQQFQEFHPPINVASAVICAPSLDRSAEVFRCLQRLVSRHSSGGDGLLRFLVPAGLDDCMCAVLLDRIVHLRMS